MPRKLPKNVFVHSTSGIEYLLVQDAADYLKVSVSTVSRYLDAGRLQGKRFGGIWFVRLASLDNLEKPALGRPRAES